MNNVVKLSTRTTLWGWVVLSAGLLSMLSPLANELNVDQEPVLLCNMEYGQC
jgi:hypothetical protein